MNPNNETENAEPAAEPDGLMASIAVEPAVEATKDEMPHRAEDEQPAKEERPEWLDEKFGTGEDLQKSYDELQKKFSQGKHKSPDEYSTDVLTNAGYNTDDPLVDTYLGWAKKYGVNQEAFDELAGSITSMAGENEQQAKFNLKAERDALGPNADAIIKSNVQWADGLLRKGIITAELREEMNFQGGTALGQLLFQTYRTASGDMSRMPTASVAEDQMSTVDWDAEMDSKLADPLYKSGDPAFVNMVEKAYLKRHP